MAHEFKYERRAMAGDEMPDGLSFAEQHMFLGLRCLYDQYRKGIINRDTAKSEKNKLFKTYEYDLMWEDIAAGFIESRKLTETARAEYRKNPCHENAVKIIECIEGVRWQNG